MWSRVRCHLSRFRWDGRLERRGGGCRGMCLCAIRACRKVDSWRRGVGLSFGRCPHQRGYGSCRWIAGGIQVVHQCQSGTGMAGVICIHRINRKRHWQRCINLSLTARYFLKDEWVISACQNGRWYLGGRRCMKGCFIITAEVDSVEWSEIGWFSWDIGWFPSRDGVWNHNTELFEIFEALVLKLLHVFTFLL